MKFHERRYTSTLYLPTYLLVLLLLDLCKYTCSVTVVVIGALNCAATSRHDVVVRHDVDDSSEQKQRRQWDDQDVGHVLRALDSAELSSSCSASQTSCSESLSQNSGVADDVDTTPAAQHSTDVPVTITNSDTALQPFKSTGLPHLPV